MPGMCKISVQCPEMEGSEKLTGQVIDVDTASLADSVATLKVGVWGCCQVGTGSELQAIFGWIRRD
eukprot:62557-Chlamydomonas_euryale.AAC.1